MLTAIIMASGLSRRMGENKLLLNYNGQPIYTYIINAVKASKIDDVIVVTPYAEIIDFCTTNNIKAVFNDNPEVGQQNSVRLGVNAANNFSDYMFFVADQPLISAEVIDCIVDFYAQNIGCIIVPEYKKSPANPRIFPNKLREVFLSNDEDVRGSCIIKQNPDLVKMIEVEDGLAFFDIDTAEDYNDLLNNTIKL